MRIQVSFDGVWVTDPVTGRSVRSIMPDRVRASTRNVEVRQLAARRMVVRKPGQSWTADVMLQLLTDADVALLEEWAGTVVLLRDSAGWRQWCTFAGVEVTTLPDGVSSNVKVSFVGTDFDESA